MEITREIEHLKLPATCVAVGVFDGVHLGHAAVLREAVTGAAALGVVAAALTFDPHPEQVLRPQPAHRPRPAARKPQKAPGLLTTIPERAALIERTGIEVLVVAAFDRAFADQSPECFAQGVLVEQLHARCVVAGEGFAFGRGGQGNIRTLTDLGRRLGFCTTAVERVTADGQVVSSSRVRELIAAGDIERATAFLGHYYTISGRVVAGDRRGRAVVGIPTANLCVGEGKLLPPNGVYGVRAHLEGMTAGLPAVANIGVRPTFHGAGVGGAPRGEGAPPTVEAHLLDFSGAALQSAFADDGRGGAPSPPAGQSGDRPLPRRTKASCVTDDLYGRQLTLEVVSRLREERAFASPSALQRQIQKDIARARRILRTA